MGWCRSIPNLQTICVSLLSLPSSHVKKLFLFRQIIIKASRYKFLYGSICVHNGKCTSNQQCICEVHWLCPCCVILVTTALTYFNALYQRLLDYQNRRWCTNKIHRLQEITLYDRNSMNRIWISQHGCDYKFWIMFMLFSMWHNMVD